MHISIRTTDQRVMQFGVNVGEMDGCENVEIDDSLLDTLQQPGIKTLEADGTISIAPDLAAQAAEQARQQAIADAEAQRLADAEILTAALPTQEAKDALKRLLGL